MTTTLSTTAASLSLAQKAKRALMNAQESRRFLTLAEIQKLSKETRTAYKAVHGWMIDSNVCERKQVLCSVTGKVAWGYRVKAGVVLTLN